MEEEKEEKKTKKAKAKLITVPTGSALAYELPDGTQLNDAEMMLDIWNMVYEVKRAIA